MNALTIPDLAGIDLTMFTSAYLEAAYFSDTGEEDQPPADAELSLEARASALEDCRAFALAAAPLLREAVNRDGYDDIRAGADFWFTRNGHGVGYWDRDELTELDGEDSDLGDRLAGIATQFGEVSLYLGDDGLIYLG